MTNPHHHYSLIKTYKSFYPQWLLWIHIYIYIFRCTAVICLSVTMQHFFYCISLCSLWIISHWISCRTGISAVAVALAGQWGVVPDRAASSTITELESDCSLLPSSSLSYFFPHFLHVNHRRTYAYKFSHILSHILTVSPFVYLPTIHIHVYP